MNTESSSIFFKIHNFEKLPKVNFIKSIFIVADENDYTNYIEYLINGNYKTEFEQFLYYIILFRDTPEIQKILNSDKIKINLLEHLVMYAYGYTIMKEGSPDKVLDDLLFFLSEDKLLKLCLESSHLSRDFLFVVFILSKLSIRKIDEYFTKTEYAHKIIKTFAILPQSQIHEIIYRNTVLFDYLITLMPSHLDEHIASDFFNKYSGLITQMHEINNLIRQYKSNRETTPERQDLTRIAILVAIMTKYDSTNLDINFLGDNEFMTSSEDKIIAYEITTNPLYVDVLKKLKDSHYFDTNSVEMF